MSQTKLFTCDQCQKEGKDAVLPSGWIAGASYPVPLAKFSGATWAVTVCTVPTDVQQKIALGTPQHDPAPIHNGYQNSILHLCSFDCLRDYLANVQKVNAEVVAADSKPFPLQIGEAVVSVLDERDRRKLISADQEPRQ